MILNNEDTGPITLLKHPTKDVYVVLVDGHHRYYACLELGKKELDCAVAGSYSSILFYLAMQGRFQPSLKINVLRHPIIARYNGFKRKIGVFLNDTALKIESK